MSAEQFNLNPALTELPNLEGYVTYPRRVEVDPDDPQFAPVFELENNFDVVASNLNVASEMAATTMSTTERAAINLTSQAEEIEENFEEKTTRLNQVLQIVEEHRAAFRELKSQLDQDLVERHSDLDVLQTTVLAPLAAATASDQANLEQLKQEMLHIRANQHENSDGFEKISQEYRTQRQEQKLADAEHIRAQGEYTRLKAEYDAEEARVSDAYRNDFENNPNPDHALRDAYMFVEHNLHVPGGVPESADLVTARQALADASEMLEEVTRIVENLKTRRQVLQQATEEYEEELIEKDVEVKHMTEALALKQRLEGIAQTMQCSIRDDIAAREESSKRILVACDELMDMVYDQTREVEEINVRDKLVVPAPRSFREYINGLAQTVQELFGTAEAAETITEQPQQAPSMDDSFEQPANQSEADQEQAEDSELMQVITVSANV